MGITCMLSYLKMILGNTQIIALGQALCCNSYIASLWDCLRKKYAFDISLDSKNKNL